MSIVTPNYGQTERQLASPGRAMQHQSRLRFGHVRAPKRSMVEHRSSHRARRAQKGDCSNKLPSSLNEPSSPALSSTSTVSIEDSAGSVGLAISQENSQNSTESGEHTLKQYSLSDYKRPRSGDSALSKGLSSSAPESRCSDSTTSEGPSLVLTEPLSKFTCDTSLLDTKRLGQLLLEEARYHPNNEFLHYVNPEREDKVDAALRNEAVHNLRFMHNVLFNLSTETFCKAINLIDRFIVKVKVKPKYMACVATAAYCTTSRLACSKEEKLDLPTADTLVQITRCGGNAADLFRMEEILASKLCNDLSGVCAFDFLSVFTDCLVDTDYQLDHASIRAERSDSESLASSDSENYTNEHQPSDDGVQASGRCGRRGLLNKRGHLIRRVMTRLEIAMCSLEVYRFRPVLLALSLLVQAGVTGLSEVVDICRVSWNDVADCVRLVDDLYDLYYRDPVPFCRRQLVWNLSKRTLFRIGYSCPTPLDTISEDYEPADEDDWLLPSLFEP